MSPPEPPIIPRRAETLEILRLMGQYAPILMISGDDKDGVGARWTIHGQPIQPGIARYLMGTNYIVDDGVTELGARKFAITPAGVEFREAGIRWWESLGFFERLKIKFFG
jgi:hypothetical protein